MSLTPLSLMIGPLNQYLRNTTMTPLDAAEDIMERLRKGGFLVICAGCGRDWTDYCKCSRSSDDQPDPPFPHGSVEDGFGSEWGKCLRAASCGLQVVRPGKVQCWCDDPDAADPSERGEVFMSSEEFLASLDDPDHP